MTGDAVRRMAMSYPPCNTNSSSIGNDSSIIGNNSSIIGNNTLFDDDPCLLKACVQYQVNVAITISFLVGILMVSRTINVLKFIAISRDSYFIHRDSQT